MEQITGLYFLDENSLLILRLKYPIHRNFDFKRFENFTKLYFRLVPTEQEFTEQAISYSISQEGI